MDWKQMNLAVRFLLELCVLAALGYWGFHTGRGTALKLLAGLGAPLVVALVWGTFGSPQAAVQLSGVLHLALEVAVFGSGVWALYASGRSGLATALAAVIIINRFLMYLWHQ